MKKYFGGAIVLIVAAACSGTKTMYHLSESPKKIEKFYEIATCYPHSLPAVYNALSAAERIFIYYIFRAGLPGHRIFADQNHRNTLEVTELFEDLIARQEEIKQLSGVDGAAFVQDALTYLVYLWTNHGPYFKKEHAHNKRTPAVLGLQHLTPENLIAVLKALGDAHAEEKVTRLQAVIFDKEYEATSCVPGSIEQSSVNIYQQGFTEEDFNKMPLEHQNKINAYFYVQEAEGKRITGYHAYKIGGKYDQELSVAAHWLGKAHEHALCYPEHFDTHLVTSLADVIDFVRTGDEEKFRKHSIAWTKSKSRVDYLFGFIETYQDPKDRRGMFSAEATIKSVDMQVLNALLPKLEKQLPFKEEFKRQNLDSGASMPNASINVSVFAAGDLGPLSMTAAYCLPNYSDIRAEHGSKQIIYQVDKGLAQAMNPELNAQLFNSSKQCAWLAQHDPEEVLHRDIWTVHCILHETLGHGSGRLHQHTFKEGEQLTVGGVTYKVGDTIPVTEENESTFLGQYSSALEELRAEIIALYTSIYNFDDLAAAGLYKDWPKKIGKQELIKQFVYDMCWTGLRRLWSQADGATEISGAHAQANMTILQYLLDGGGVVLTREEKVINGTSYTVLGFDITDLEKVLADIKDLAIVVQTIKSTGDTLGLKQLIETYGRYRCDVDQMAILKKNLKAVMGDLKVSTQLFPLFKPLQQGDVVVDIVATWPSGIVEQHMTYKKLALSKE